MRSRSMSRAACATGMVGGATTAGADITSRAVLGARGAVMNSVTRSVRERSPATTPLASTTGTAPTRLSSMVRAAEATGVNGATT